MNRPLLEGIIRGQIILHEQIHDERVVKREELVSAIADGIETEHKREASTRLTEAKEAIIAHAEGEAAASLTRHNALAAKAEARTNDN